MTAISIQSLSGFQLPRKELTMLLIQPEVAFQAPGSPRLKPDSAAQQRVLLKQALEIARSKRAHFVLFPEYALPSDGWEECRQLVEAMLPEDSILIAGLDAMAYERYLALAAGTPECPPAASADQYDHTWVNAGVVAAKNHAGEVSWFFQPKLYPAAEEQGLGSMYGGQHLFLFEVDHLRLGFVICRDLISHVEVRERVDEEERVRQIWLPDWVKEQLTARSLDLDIFGVIQHNDEPEHREFLRAKEVLLTSGRVRSVVALNRAEPPKAALSAFYFPIGSFKERPSDPAQSYSFLKVPGHQMARARFRAEEPALFQVGYQPRPHNGEDAIRPLIPALECWLIPSGVGAECAPRSSGSWAFHYHGERQKGAAYLEQIPAPVRSRFLGYYDEIHRQLQAIPDELAQGRLLELLFACQEGYTPEPHCWSDQQGGYLGEAVGALALLRLTGPVTIDPADPGVMGRLGREGHYVAAVAGHEELQVESCLESYATLVGVIHRSRPPSHTVVIVEHHLPLAGEAGHRRLQLLDAAQRAIRRFESRLQAIDAALLPANCLDDGSVWSERFDDRGEPWLSCHSGMGLKGYLLDRRYAGVDELAEVVAKEVFG